MQNVNSVVVTGNLTRDPVLRYTASGTPVCNLGVAVNGRRKNSHEEWVDKPNFLNVTVWGARGESCVQYLAKGSPVAIEGRLDWRVNGEGDERREYVEIVASMVQFLGKKDDQAEQAEGVEESPQAGGSSEEPVPAGVGAGGEEGDIDF
jgi:single-strand DNA-binding protein